MRRFALSFALLLSLVQVGAQVIGSDLKGQELIDFLDDNYTSTNVRSYNEARDFLFGQLSNDGGTVECFYSGTTISVSGANNSAIRTSAQGQNFDTEHLWPQSFFDENNQQRSDLHHLVTTWNTVNNARSNYPFADFTDADADRWYRANFVQLTSDPNPSLENTELSRRALNFQGGTTDFFEPRDEVKGDVARAIFYFWAIYQDDDAVANDNNDNNAFFLSMKERLRIWHEQDPATEEERERSNQIAVIQGRDNPFVLDESLVVRAFFPQEIDFPSIPEPAAVGLLAGTIAVALALRFSRNFVGR